jgi:3,4-dihydroxy 2-butanone 4-phosphate synthase / GTP cyclohydrolase II
MNISNTTELVAELAAGRMVVLVDDEDRENEGDVILAAEHSTPEAINFMAKYCRGLICLTLRRERCERLNLPPMVSHNGTKHGTAFTVSIEAVKGIDTGISAADRSQTVLAAVAKNAKATDLVSPGHVFPLQAADGGVLMRAGHTEAGCDLAALAGLEPAAVICEVMNDDGTMARLPDLIKFAKKHGLKIGTIAQMIEHRSQQEALVVLKGEREMRTAQGTFNCQTYRDIFGGLHLALSVGSWTKNDDVLVRVHEPFAAIDLLDVGSERHSWPLPLALQALQKAGSGVALLLNCAETGEAMEADALESKSAHAAGETYLRTYGVGAQILRNLKVSRMKILGPSRRMPSLTGFGLQVVSFVAKPD